MTFNLKATMDNLLEIMKMNKRKQEHSNNELYVNKQVYSMTNIVSITEYVFLIMFKLNFCEIARNIYILHMYYFIL